MLKIHCMGLSRAFLLHVALLFVACEPEKKPQTLPAPETRTPGAKPAPRKQCFEWKEKNSRAIASFTVQNDSVSGTLAYLFSEKDNSKGIIKGVMRGDTIFADYAYTSEGQLSVMEVVFLLQGDMLIQGHGPMQAKGKKMVYAFPERLDFITGFKGRPCE